VNQQEEKLMKLVLRGEERRETRLNAREIERLYQKQKGIYSWFHHYTCSMGKMDDTSVLYILFSFFMVSPKIGTSAKRERQRDTGETKSRQA